jgi:RNA recognition motif-containing protein
MQAIRRSQQSSKLFTRSYVQQQQNAHQVYVGGIAWAATNEDIRKHFSSCGNVIAVCLSLLANFSIAHFQVKVPVDRESGRSRGFAFVAFDQAGAVDEALKLAGSELMGRMIRVNLCNEPSDRQNRE